jgi:hypothetical protein
VKHPENCKRLNVPSSAEVFYPWIALIYNWQVHISMVGLPICQLIHG